MKRIIGIILAFAIVMTCAFSSETYAATKVGTPKNLSVKTESGNPVLKWDSVSGATGYRVYRKTASDESWEVAKTLSKTTYTDTEWSGEDGEKIKYCVKAYVQKNDKKTYGDKSDSVSWTVPKGAGTPQGFGQVKGLITWQYNSFVGTRGDNGAQVMLIPKKGKTKKYDNGLAAMFHEGVYDSGIMVAICDGYGNFDFGDEVPAGEYLVLIVSKSTTGSTRFNYEKDWKKSMKSTFSKYFSKEDLKTLLLFMGYNKTETMTITVKDGKCNSISHDFGNTYI